MKSSESDEIQHLVCDNASISEDGRFSIPEDILHVLRDKVIEHDLFSTRTDEESELTRLWNCVAIYAYLCDGNNEERDAIRMGYIETFPVFINALFTETGVRERITHPYKLIEYYKDWLKNHADMIGRWEKQMSKYQIKTKVKELFYKELLRVLNDGQV